MEHYTAIRVAAAVVVYSLIHPVIGWIVVRFTKRLSAVVQQVYEEKSEVSWSRKELLLAAVWPVTILFNPFLVIALVFGLIYKRLFLTPGILMRWCKSLKDR